MNTRTIAATELVEVPVGEQPWAVTDEDVFGIHAAILRHDFPARIDEDGTTYNRRIEYLLPRREQPVDFDGNQALVNVDAASVVRWSTFEDHVKADVVFTRRPDTLQLWFAVNLIGLTALEEDDGGLALVDPATGELVGKLAGPFLLDRDRNRHDLAWNLDVAGNLTVALPDLADELWVGAVFDPTTIGTSTANSPVATPNQKKLARLSGGQLVGVVNSTGTNAQFWYSTDNGATWTQYTSGSTDLPGWSNGSIFPCTDSGGGQRLIVAWKQSGTGGGRTSGYVYTLSGTFNAGATTLTWDTAFTTSINVYDYPDVVACSEGTGLAVWTFMSVLNGTNNSVDAYRYTVSSSGVMSTHAASYGGATVSTSLHSWPSAHIDPSSKNIGFVFSKGGTGTGKGVVFVLGSYSAGAWSWGSERPIDTGRYIQDSKTWAVCRFDGTRWIIGAFLYNGTNYDLRLWDRDAGDTTTTAQTTASVSGVASGGSTAMFGGSLTYDNVGNVFFFGANGAGTDVAYQKWTRATTTLGTRTAIESSLTAAAVTNFVSAKPGYSNNSMEVLYQSGGSSPFSVKYALAASLNTAPSAPTWGLGAGPQDVNANLTLPWTFNDPDAGDTQSAYALKRDIGGATTHWYNGTDWTSTTETWVTSTTSSVTLASGWGADSDADHHYYVATKDAAGAGGTSPAYSSVLTITPSAKVNPTLDHPSAAEVVGASSFDAQWTVSEQTAYKVTLYDSAGTTTLWPSGWVTDPTTIVRRRTIGYSLVNGTTYKLGIQTKNNEGLASDEVIHTFSVSYTAPATPTLVATASNTLGRVTVAITNPTPSGGQPSIDHNNVWRRHVGLTDAIRIATGVANNGSFVDAYPGHRESFEYQIEAVGTNGITSFSAWTA